MERCVNSALGKIYCCPIWFCYNSTVTHNHESNLIYCKKARISHHHFFSVFIFPLFTSFFLSLVFSIFPFSLVLKIDWWKTFSKSICSSLLFLCSEPLSILPSFSYLLKDSSSSSNIGATSSSTSKLLQIYNYNISFLLPNICSCSHSNYIIFFIIHKSHSLFKMQFSEFDFY